MAYLFAPFRLRDLELKNRIAMSPMCMYSASGEGLAGDWHLLHYGARAMGGVGLIIQEATAVEKRGRISNRDLGLWDEVQVAPLGRLLEMLHSLGAKAGVQLAHAGRKCEVPGERLVAPSAMRWSDAFPVPEELSGGEIQQVVRSFGQAAGRAARAGYDMVEVHAAHGYLIHQFLSPLSNTRRDQYGGSRENRVRFLREVLEEVRAAVPPGMPVLIRVSAADYAEGGLDIKEIVEIIKLVRDRVDLVDVSSGGVLGARIDAYPGYQVPFAASIRENCGLPTQAVGLITRPEQAEGILGSGQADLVALGRELLRNPYWPLHAARVLREDVDWPAQYSRAKI